MSPDPEKARLVEPCRVAGVPDDKGRAVVVDPPLVGLNEDVSLVPHGGRQVEEGASQAHLAVARRRPEAELFVPVGSIHRHQPVSRLKRQPLYPHSN